tara:strand:+ start:5174 stop:6130 length:957 start_codon:yes stop_codon:yes gene_type:complete
MNLIRVAHIGLPKTGSTFLQLNYFSKFNCNFFSTQCPFSWPSELNFVYLLNKEVEKCNHKWKNLDELNRNDLKIQKRLNSLYLKNKVKAERFSTKSKKVQRIIISSEGLYGMNIPVNIHHMKLLKHSSIEKVIFIIRNQSDWFESFWKQIIVREDRFSKYIEPDFFYRATENNIGYSMNWLNYITSINKIFSPKNVLVLPYEMLVKNPLLFFFNLNKFIGLEPKNQIDYTNKLNISDNSLIYKGSLIDDIPYIGDNRFMRRLTRSLAYSLPIKNKIMNKSFNISISKDLINKIKLKYSRSNKDIEKIINIDLASYNYY